KERRPISHESDLASIRRPDRRAFGHRGPGELHRGLVIRLFDEDVSATLKNHLTAIRRQTGWSLSTGIGSQWNQPWRDGMRHRPKTEPRYGRQKQQGACRSCRHPRPARPRLRRCLRAGRLVLDLLSAIGPPCVNLQPVGVDRSRLTMNVAVHRKAFFALPTCYSANATV